MISTQDRDPSVVYRDDIDTQVNQLYRRRTQLRSRQTRLLHKGTPPDHPDHVSILSELFWLNLLFNAYPGVFEKG